ncbi:hypothetical protein D3C71_1654530 [compost metagenome]
MVSFFAGGFLQVGAQFGVARDSCLGGVKRLGAYLSHMIYAHQGTGQFLLGGVECRLGDAVGRRPFRRLGLGEKRPQCVVCGGKQRIHKNL